MEAESATSSANYVFMADMALNGGGDPAILDFGCGQGQMLELILERQANARIFGVDTYRGHYADWLASAPGAARERIKPMDDHIPFDDASFDVVIANQVFEHIATPWPWLAEVARVLRPGGRLVAAFPLNETWYEGHVGLYFAHWLHGWPRLQRAYLEGAHRLRIGLGQEGYSAPEWARVSQRVLHEECHYHDWGTFRARMSDLFGEPPHSLARDYMLFRIRRSARLKALAPLAASRPAAPLLSLVCTLRAGRIFSVVKRR